MPAFKLLPDSNVALKPLSPPPHASAHQQHLVPHGTHIYLALAALTVISLASLVVRRFSHQLPSWAQEPGHLDTRQPDFRKDSKSYSWVSSAPTSTSSSAHPPFYRPGFEKEAQTVWAAGLLASPAAGRVRTGLTASVPGMEEQRDRTRSRGVSTSAAGSRHHVLSSLAPGSRKTSRSPRSQKSRSSSRRHSNSSDGSARAKRKGKGLMDGDNWGGSLTQDTVLGLGLNRGDSPGLSGDNTDGEYGHGHSVAAPKFSRPPPPPPMTPPTRSTAMFTFQDRRPSYAVSIPPQLDTSFIHRPNPDYMAASTSTGNSPKSATATPKRRSYAKSVPIGIPISTGSRSSSSNQSHDMTWGESSTDTFSPSSYPPSSPHLPPPPPGSYDEVIYDYDGHEQGEIDLQGEIISVMDDAGHGWKRHTRVYGGGVCLACVAAGEREGGFYGDTVPLSERR